MARWLPAIVGLSLGLSACSNPLIGTWSGSARFEQVRSELTLEYEDAPPFTCTLTRVKAFSL